MLCEIATYGGFLTTWVAITIIGVTVTGAMSAILFYRSYWKPTHASWRRKINPAYPEPTMVRREIVQMLKGIAVATLPPALSLHLIGSGWSKAYCGLGDYGVGYLIFTFVLVCVGTDFFEFYYHRLGHLLRPAWTQHKGHHVFFNPSPFSVIADDVVDQFFRATPMLFFPLLIPINIDLLFFTFTAFFYGYGVYIHWGHELRWPDAHHRWLNTSYHHYIHHARSTFQKPYHTGFFIKLWDQMFDSTYGSECLCSKCACERGERSVEAFLKVEVPNYSVLLQPSFWWGGKTATRQEALGTR